MDTGETTRRTTDVIIVPGVDRLLSTSGSSQEHTRQPATYYDSNTGSFSRSSQTPDKTLPIGSRPVNLLYVTRRWR